MGRKKIVVPEEIIVSADEHPDLVEVRTKAVSQTRARQLLREAAHAEPKPRRPRTEAQEANWQRVLELNRERRAAQLEAAKQAEEEAQAALEADLKTGRKVKVPVKPPKVRKAAGAAPAPTKPTRAAKRPAPSRYQTAPAAESPLPSSDEDSGQSETELDTDIPSEVEVRKPLKARVVVPRRVKDTIKAVKAINQSLASAADDPRGYKEMVSRAFSASALLRS